MRKDNWIKKGMRVRASWFETKLVGLAGTQMKMGATQRVVVGVVTSVRGDAPRLEDCQEVKVLIQQDDGGEVVEVDPKNVQTIL